MAQISKGTTYDIFTENIFSLDATEVPVTTSGLMLTLSANDISVRDIIL